MSVVKFMAPPAVLSKSGFALRHGVGASAVSNWIARGVLYGEALTDDGRIVVEVAERQLKENLDPARTTASGSAVEPDNGPSLREQILAVELEQKRRRLEAEKGVYVRADQVRAERGRALAEMIAAIDGWLGDVASALGLDRDQAARMRTSWRRFRERQADVLVAEAQALPELLADDRGDQSFTDGDR